MAKWPCIKCKNVASKGKGGKGMQCSFCELYCHQHCANVSDKLYKHLKEQDSAGFHFWICVSCKSNSMVFKKQLDQLSKRVDKIEAETTKNMKDITETQAEISKVNKHVDVIEARKSDLTETTQDSVFSEISERESKKCNLVLHKVKEPSNTLKGTEKKDADITKIMKIAATLNQELEKDDIKFCARIGEANDKSTVPRPLLLGLKTENKKKSLLENAYKLANSDYSHISLVPDLTKRQRDQDSNVHKEAEKKYEEMSEEESLNWMWRATGPRGHQYLVKVRRHQRQQQQDHQGNSGAFRQRRGSKRIHREEEEEEEDQPPRKQ